VAGGRRHGTAGRKRTTAGRRFGTAGRQHATAGRRRTTAGLKHGKSVAKELEVSIQPFQRYKQAVLGFQMLE